MENLESYREQELVISTASNIEAILAHPNHRFIYDPQLDDLLSISPRNSAPRGGKYLDAYTEDDYRYDEQYQAENKIHFKSRLRFLSEQVKPFMVAQSMKDAIRIGYTAEEIIESDSFQTDSEFYFENAVESYDGFIYEDKLVSFASLAINGIYSHAKASQTTVEISDGEINRSLIIFQLDDKLLNALHAIKPTNDFLIDSLEKYIGAEGLYKLIPAINEAGGNKDQILSAITRVTNDFVLPINREEFSSVLEQLSKRIVSYLEMVEISKVSPIQKPSLEELEDIHSIVRDISLDI
jgi:hypothetical protein